jgi:hypothetical protein
MDERYEHGYWSCAYQVSPVEHPPTLTRLLDIIREVEGHETGWPVWLILSNRPEMRPYPKNEIIECWLHETGLGDFWRADPRGRMFLARRPQEDLEAARGIEPGKYFELTLPAWRTGECLLHASRFAAKLEAESVELTMTWEGLQGRELSAFGSPHRMLMPGRICRENTVRTAITTPAAAIADTLPDLVRQLVEPLFTRFDFFEAPAELYTTETERMRRGT